MARQGLRGLLNRGVPSNVIVVECSRMYMNTSFSCMYVHICICICAPHDLMYQDLRNSRSIVTHLVFL